MNNCGQGVTVIRNTKLIAGQLSDGRGLNRARVLFAIKLFCKTFGVKYLDFFLP